MSFYSIATNVTTNPHSFLKYSRVNVSLSEITIVTKACKVTFISGYST